MKAFTGLGLMVVGLTAGLSTGALARKTEVQTVTHRLHIPDEIAPAANPYLYCRLESLGAKIKGADGKPVETLAQPGGDCSGLRVKAATDAETLLAKAGKDEASRAAMITDTLKSIDDFADEMRGAMAAPKDK